ncbi:MAG: hypothetical protein WC539_01520 [Nitrospirota bacterium]
MKENSLAVFENYKIRRVYNEESETWYFSVVNIIQALTQQPDYQTSRKYWNKLKERLKKEGSQSVTNCHRLKLKAADGKQYLTDIHRQIAETMNAVGVDENKVAGKKGGGIAKKARRELEAKTGRKFSSSIVKKRN